MNGYPSVASSDDGKVIITTAKVLETSESSYLYYSLDSGVTWLNAVSDPALTETFISVSVSANGNVIYALAQSGKVVYSHDKGLTWKVNELSDTAKNIIVNASGDFIVYQATNGLRAKSLSVSDEFQELPINAQNIKTISMSRDGNVILFSAGTSIYYSDNKGKVFKSRYFGVDLVDLVDVAVSADGLYIYAISSDKIYASKNIRRTFREQTVLDSEGNKLSNLQSIVLSSNGKVVIVSSISNQNNTGGLWYITEDDKTWQKVVDTENKAISGDFKDFFLSNRKNPGDFLQSNRKNPGDFFLSNRKNPGDFLQSNRKNPGDFDIIGVYTSDAIWYTGIKYEKRNTSISDRWKKVAIDNLKSVIITPDASKFIIYNDKISVLPVDLAGLTNIEVVPTTNSKLKYFYVYVTLRGRRTLVRFRRS
jgi:hypothetical protein